jgi:hypothetical protein
VNKLDLERVLEQEPILCSIGFGLSNLTRYTLEERKIKLAQMREDLLNDVDICHKVAEWLAANVQSRKTINKNVTSYGYKHEVERAIGTYVSNGAFIAAAIYCGFKYQLVDPNSQCPNAYFNIKTVKNKFVKPTGDLETVMSK